MAFRCIGALTALATAVVPVQASAQVSGPVPAFDPAAVARVANSCTAESAFGYRFAEASPGAPRQGDIPADWRPFDRLDLHRSDLTGRLWQAEAIAFVQMGNDDPDRDTLLAVTDSLDKAVQASGRFRTRTADGYRVTYGDPVGPDGQPSDRDVELEIQPLLGLVWATCTDRGLEEEIGNEGAGGVRLATRPVPPSERLAAPPTPAACNDPDEARRLVARFSLIGDALRESGPDDGYFRRLSHWYGQQLIDAGVWDQDRKEAFAFDLLEDPELEREAKAQAEHLAPFIVASVTLDISKDDGDLQGACESAVRMIRASHDMTLASQGKWRRIEVLYRAEAERLGVTLKD